MLMDSANKSLCWLVLPLGVREHPLGFILGWLLILESGGCMWFAWGENLVYSQNLLQALPSLMMVHGEK